MYARRVCRAEHSLPPNRVNPEAMPPRRGRASRRRHRLRDQRTGHCGDHTQGRRTHINMAAYVITYLDITDPQAFAAYQAAAFPTIATYGGRPLVAGGNLEVLEGMLHPKSVVVLEFDTLDQARKWYASPEYAKTIPMRQRAADANFIIVEGLPAKRG